VSLTGRFLAAEGARPLPRGYDSTPSAHAV